MDTEVHKHTSFELTILKRRHHFGYLNLMWTVMIKIEHFKFSQPCLWSSNSSAIWLCVVGWMSPDVSKGGISHPRTQRRIAW